MALICERCGVEIAVGMYPFCKGNPADHGSVTPKTALFPFEGRHITPDGRPITIESMTHLRRIERDYGVVLPAFSKSNIHDTDPIPSPPVYRRRGR